MLLWGKQTNQGLVIQASFGKFLLCDLPIRVNIHPSEDLLRSLQGCVIQLEAGGTINHLVNGGYQLCHLADIYVPITIHIIHTRNTEVE